MANAIKDMDQWQTEKYNGRVESRTYHILSAEQHEGNFSQWRMPAKLVGRIRQKKS